MYSRLKFFMETDVNVMLRCIPLSCVLQSTVSHLRIRDLRLEKWTALKGPVVCCKQALLYK